MGKHSAGYRQPEVVPDALPHPMLKLIRGVQDTNREKIYKAITGSRAEIDENCLWAYLGSDSESSLTTPSSTMSHAMSAQAFLAGYRPTQVGTDAMQHAMVKLAGDAEDTSRKETMNKAVTGSRAEIGENDLRAYS